MTPTVPWIGKIWQKSYAPGAIWGGALPFHEQDHDVIQTAETQQSHAAASCLARARHSANGPSPAGNALHHDGDDHDGPRSPRRLVDVTEANAALDEIGSTMRDALLNWPARVAGLIAA
jgi:hypothetical protein